MKINPTAYSFFLVLAATLPEDSGAKSLRGQNGSQIDGLRYKAAARHEKTPHAIPRVLTPTEETSATPTKLCNLETSISCMAPDGVPCKVYKPNQGTSEVPVLYKYTIKNVGSSAIELASLDTNRHGATESLVQFIEGTVSLKPEEQKTIERYQIVDFSKTFQQRHDVDMMTTAKYQNGNRSGTCSETRSMWWMTTATTTMTPAEEKTSVTPTKELCDLKASISCMAPDGVPCKDYKPKQGTLKVPVIYNYSIENVGSMALRLSALDTNQHGSAESLIDGSLKLEPQEVKTIQRSQNVDFSMEFQTHNVDVHAEARYRAPGDHFGGCSETQSMSWMTNAPEATNIVPADTQAEATTTMPAAATTTTTAEEHQQKRCDLETGISCVAHGGVPCDDYEPEHGTSTKVPVAYRYWIKNVGSGDVTLISLETEKLDSTEDLLLLAEEKVGTDLNPEEEKTIEWLQEEDFSSRNWEKIRMSVRAEFADGYTSGTCSTRRSKWFNV